MNISDSPPIDNQGPPQPFELAAPPPLERSILNVNKKTVTCRGTSRGGRWDPGSLVSAEGTPAISAVIMTGHVILSMWQHWGPGEQRLQAHTKAANENLPANNKHGEQTKRQTNKYPLSQTRQTKRQTKRQTNRQTTKRQTKQQTRRTTNTAHISSLTRSTNLARGVQRTGLLSISGAAQQVAHKSAHLCPYIWADMGNYMGNYMGNFAHIKNHWFSLVL